MRITIIVFFQLISFFLNGQDFCTNGEIREMQILASSGLNLRANPSLESSIVEKIPYGTIVWICHSLNQPQVQIDKKKGRWQKTEYNGKAGWLFSGYLEEWIFSNEKISLFVPSDGSVDFNFKNLTPSPTGYYGFYKNKKGNHFLIKKMDLKDSIHIEKSEIPDLLLSGLSNLPDSIQGQIIDEKLFPGEIKYFHSNYLNSNHSGIHHYFYSKGTPVLSDEKDLIFNEIKDYQLRLRFKPNDKPTEEYILFRKNLHSWPGGTGYEASISIYWSGDLNGDNILDFVFKVFPNYKGWIYRLMISDPQGKRTYKVLDVGGGSGC